MKKLLLIYFAWLTFNCGSTQGQIVKLRDVVSGNETEIPTFENAKLVVVIFMSHQCPYAKPYEDRIIDLYDKYHQSGVNFIVANSNNPDVWASDSEENMKKSAMGANYPFGYYSDKEKKLASLLGARKTPEVFVLAKNQDGFQIKYQGAIDDNPQSQSSVHSFYLEEALTDLLQGKSVSNTIPIGCRIKN